MFTQRQSLLVAMLLVILAACTFPPPTGVPPQVLMIPTPTEPPLNPNPPTSPPTPTPTTTPTPTATFTFTPTWTPIVIIVTYTPSQTYTPSMTFTPSDTPTPTDTFTPSPPPSFTPTQDQPAPVVMAVAPDSGSLVTAIDDRCAPVTTRIAAQVDSSVGLYTIRLNYVFNNGPGQMVEMHNDGEGLYSAEVGPFNEPGVLAYWITMADNWGKWTSYDPQELIVSDCDLQALDATAIAAATNAATATALAGGGNSARFNAVDLDLDTPYQTPIDITLSAENGTPPYTFLLNTLPANGQVTGTPPSVTYTPNNGFIGDDTFTFLATDANGFTDIGVVRINVGLSTLDAEDQTVNVPFGAVNYQITLVASGGTPPYTQVNIVTPPGVGTLTPTADPFVYNYTPPGGFLGTDSFVWSVTDSTPAIDQGTVTINVVPATPTGRIVFASDEGSPGVFDIFVMNADGTGRTNLTNTPAVNEVDPSWSAGGLKIVYASNADGDYDIYTMNSDGSGVTGPLTVNSAMDRYPAWAPNNGQIAFATDRDSNIEIYTMNTDGSGQTRRTFNAVDDLNPAWSPDSSQITFQQGAPGAYDVYVMNSDGSGVTQLTTAAGDDIEPDWSPDGTLIAFVSTRDGNYELYTMLTDGSAQTRRTNTAGSIEDRGPVWSPDGSQILYYNNQHNGGTAYEILRIWSDGSNLTRLTDNGTVADVDPDWTP